jgi:predicted ATP-binding protein involved in virulence
MTNQPKKATTRRKPATSNIKEAPVYFLSLEVENVLCFKDKQTLNLSDKNGNYAKWTVILGNNGVGKTTLLKCLAMIEKGEEEYTSPSTSAFFSSRPYVRSLFVPSIIVWEELNNLYNSHARINANILSLKQFGELSDKNQKAQIQISLDNDSSTFRLLPENINELLLEISSPEEYETFLDPNDIKKVSIVNHRINEKFMNNLLCYGYGATRKHGKELLSKTIFPRNSLSLFSEEAVLINAEEWLLQTDYAVKSASGKTQISLKKQFDHIVEILKKILPDIYNIRISSVDEENLRPKAEFQTPYGWVQLSSLGLGYRTTIAWMVDLAVRLFKRYPDSEDPLAEPAIVLVDEIDLHMHPTWQRDIMQFLTDRFPNTQFIVTAHSPLVVQAAQDANIVLLRREGDRVVIDNNPEIIENWRVDQVLTSVFEMPSARPAKIEPLLQRRKEILTKPKLTASDRAELKELEAQIGTLPTAETSEDIKAMDIIRRAAKLLDRPVTEAVE